MDPKGEQAVGRIPGEPMGATESGGTGPQLMDQAKQQTQQAVEQSKQKAVQVADQARSQLKSQLVTQKEKASGGLGEVAQALQQTSQQLQEKGQGSVAQCATAAAEQVERLSAYFRDRDVDQLTREAEDLARRQPSLFLGGAFVLGLLAARFLKSSRTDGGTGAAGSGYSTVERPHALVPAAEDAPTPVRPVTAPAYTAHDYVAGGVAGQGAASQTTTTKERFPRRRPQGAVSQTTTTRVSPPEARTSDDT